MKKLLVSLFALVLLAGCGGGSSSSKSITCDLDEETVGVPMSVEFTEADGKVGKMIIKMSDENDSYKEASDSEIQEMKDMVKETYADYDGLDAEVDVDGSVMTATITVDIQKVDSLPSNINATGMPIDELKEMKYSELVDKVKDSDGATCKEN